MANTFRGAGHRLECGMGRIRGGAGRGGVVWFTWVQTCLLVLSTGGVGGVFCLFFLSKVVRGSRMNTNGERVCGNRRPWLLRRI